MWVSVCGLFLRNYVIYFFGGVAFYAFECTVIFFVDFLTLIVVYMRIHTYIYVFGLRCGEVVFVRIGNFLCVFCVQTFDLFLIWCYVNFVGFFFFIFVGLVTVLKHSDRMPSLDQALRSGGTDISRAARNKNIHVFSYNKYSSFFSKIISYNPL